MRFEIKYLIDIHALARLHERLSQYMKPDPNAVGEDGAYFNHSIYFDSPRYAFYLEKHEGYLRRIKPRLRAYRATPFAPPGALFLELKNRHDRAVFKERAAVPEDLARRLLRAPFFDLDEEIAASETLSKFLFLTRRFSLMPRVTVLYQRRAFYSDLYPGLRITYDMRLQSSWSTVLDSQPTAFRNVLPPNLLMLELKYNDRAPAIILREIQEFQLVQVTCSKYAACVERNSESLWNMGARKALVPF